MKLKYFWIVIGGFMVYALLPISLPVLFESYDEPNVLLVRRQECGCPCPEGVIEKGHLKISGALKNKYHGLSDKDVEINLVNFPPYNDIGKGYDWDFSTSVQFKVTGEVVGADTIECDASDCEMAPRFKVNTWKAVGYYPKLMTSGYIAIPFVLLTIFGLPILLSFTISHLIRKRKAKKNAQKEENN